MIEKLIKTGNYWEDENGVAYDYKWEYIWCKIFGFCSCGDPYTAFKQVVKVLESMEKRTTYEMKNEFMFIFYWLDEKEYSEHGIGIFGSWLTEKGEELLKDMRWCVENEAGEFE